MRRHHPKPFGQIPVSHGLDVKLNLASSLSASGLEPWEIVEQAMHDWLAKNAPGALPMPSLAGFQWKKLFLPNGTVLRTMFGGKSHHCHVEEDQLRYDGKPTSPNGFANLVGGIRRNAWKVIWILFPQTQTWQLAADLRPARPARTARGRAHGNAAAPVANDAPAAMPVGPERTAAPCCRCSQSGRVDACHDNEQRQDTQHQHIARQDRQPEQCALQGRERRSETEAAEQDQPVDEQTRPHHGASVSASTTITLSSACDRMHLTISNRKKDATVGASNSRFGLLVRPASE